MPADLPGRKPWQQETQRIWRAQPLVRPVLRHRLGVDTAVRNGPLRVTCPRCGASGEAVRAGSAWRWRCNECDWPVRVEL